MDDIPYFVTHRNLVLNLLQGIVYAEITLVDQAVSIYDVTQDTFRYLMLVLQHDGIDAMILCRITVHDDVWRNIFGDAASGLYQYPASHMAFLLQDDVAAQDGVVVYVTLACQNGFETYHTVVANLHVVAEMYAVHEIVVITDAGCVAFVGSAAYDYVFPDIISVTNDQQAILASVVEILRGSAQYGAMMHFVALAHAGARKDTCTGHDCAVVANFHVTFDVSERLNRYILAELCGRIYKC